jgi:ATP-binding cassette subfamily B protein
LGEVNGNIKEIIEGLKVVKASGMRRSKGRIFDAERGIRESAKKAGFYSTAIIPTTANFMNVCYALTGRPGHPFHIHGFVLGGSRRTCSISAR